MPSEKVASLSTFSEGLMGISFAMDRWNWWVGIAGALEVQAEWEGNLNF